MSDVQTTGHAYDGIEEYDNPLPGWWKWMFVGSVIFSVGYAGYFHLGAPGRSREDEYGAALAANTRLRFAEMGELAPNGDNIAKYLYSTNELNVGKVVFKANCISCHGRNGEGGTGPNLTDSAYKHIRDLDSIATVILNGANKNAMPAWGNRLHPNEVVLVGAYVASLRGTNAAGGKPPEGREIDPWPSQEEISPAGADSNESSEADAETLDESGDI